MSNKRYPEEFKIEAVRQITETGHKVADVATRLGVTLHGRHSEGMSASARKVHTRNIDNPIVTMAPAAIREAEADTVSIPSRL